MSCFHETQNPPYMKSSERHTKNNGHNEKTPATAAAAENQAHNPKKLHEMWV